MALTELLGLSAHLQNGDEVHFLGGSISEADFSSHDGRTRGRWGLQLFNVGSKPYCRKVHSGFG